MLVLERPLESRTLLTVPPSDKPTQIVVLAQSVRFHASRPTGLVLGFEAPRTVTIVRQEAVNKSPRIAPVQP